MIPRAMRLLLLISAVLALACCGTKTPLIMSPAPVKAPLLGSSAPETPRDHNNAIREPQ
ncbi:MAG: sugar transporter [Proteobacteria bacterium]|nr:sugar transporter [Pseudomonadota bacterium]